MCNWKENSEKTLEDFRKNNQEWYVGLDSQINDDILKLRVLMVLI